MADSTYIELLNIDAGNGATRDERHEMRARAFAEQSVMFERVADCTDFAYNVYIDGEQLEACEIVLQANGDIAFCIFVDGLKEIYGDDVDLRLSELNAISQNVLARAQTLRA